MLSVFDYGDTFYMHTSASVLKPLNTSIIVPYDSLRVLCSRLIIVLCIIQLVGSPWIYRGSSIMYYLFTKLYLLYSLYVYSLLSWNFSNYATRSHDCITLKTPIYKTDRIVSP